MRSDRRVLYTRKSIRDAFLSLLESTPLEQITVKEICSLADINRATFYRNYTDLYALYDAIEEDILNAAFPNQMKSFNILEFLLLVQEYRAFYMEVFRKRNISPSSMRIIERFREYMRIAYGTGCDPQQFEMHLRYAVYGVGGLLWDWIENDCRDDAAQLATQIERITNHLFRNCSES